MSTLLPCPKCEYAITTVMDSRANAKGGIRRRRKCTNCGNRFTTVEQIEGANGHLDPEKVTAIHNKMVDTMTELAALINNATGADNEETPVSEDYRGPQH